MTLARLSSARRIQWVYFTLTLLLTVVVYILYGVNIVRWQHSPDFGWRTMYNSGPNVVAEVCFHAAQGPADALSVVSFCDSPIPSRIFARDGTILL